MRAFTWAVPVVACFAAPALAETVTVGFAPPVGQAFLYRVEQVRPMDGRDCRFVGERALRFERSATGYILHATLRRIDTDGPPAAAEPFRAALSPLLNVEHRFRVDTTGRIVGLDNMDAVWSAVTASATKMTKDYPPDTPRHRAAQRLLALFSALDEEGRLAMLAGELKPLLLFANTPLMDGAGRGLETMAGSPLGRPVPVKGSVTMNERVGDQLSVSERLAGEGVSVDIGYRLSAVTGLVEEQRRRLAMAGQWIAERRVLTPLP